jgi:hypothetical protein
MNYIMQHVTKTDTNGNVSQLELCYLRGSQTLMITRYRKCQCSSAWQSEKNTRVQSLRLDNSKEGPADEGGKQQSSVKGSLTFVDFFSGN